MKNSKETRTCIACRKKDCKYNLVRIVNSKETGITVDFNQKLEGRGSYICKNEACFDKMIKIKALSRALKTNIEEQKYKELRGVMFDR